jgi:hypothetical protein
MNFGSQQLLTGAFFGVKNGLLRLENAYCWDEIQ